MTSFRDSSLEKTRLSAAHFLAPLVLATAFLLPLPQHGQIAGLTIPCPFLGFTGLPCPFCGITRSLVSCAHGHFADAWHFHALGPLLFAFLLISSTQTVAEIVAKRRYRVREVATNSRVCDTKSATLKADNFRVRDSRFFGVISQTRKFPENPRAREKWKSAILWTISVLIIAVWLARLANFWPLPVAILTPR